jgi:D-glycero-D-manno-heptose 1,7-bisphosphate phosphatase
MDTQKPCIFFDRDGIVNELIELGYVATWNDFYLQPGFVAALRIVRQKGYMAVVVTNQPGVAKGLYTEDALNDLHRQFRAQLMTHGLDVRDILYCPHTDQDQCECRKPKPGMLIQAQEKYAVDLSRSWMVGDSEKDILAGMTAGCKTVRVCEQKEKTAADFRVEHMDDLAAVFLKELEPCVS